MKTGLNQIHQIQTKWKVSFPFVFYSSSIDGWLCKLCSEYGEGDDFWRFRAVKLYEHLNRVFFQHADSLKHKAAEKKIEIQAMITEGHIHKLMCNYKKKKKPQRREKIPNTLSHEKVF